MQTGKKHSMKPKQTWKLENRVASIQEKKEHPSLVRVSGQKWLCGEFWNRWQGRLCAHLTIVAPHFWSAIHSDLLWRGYHPTVTIPGVPHHPRKIRTRLKSSSNFFSFKYDLPNAT